MLIELGQQMKVMSLGGGVWQVDLIRRLVEMGHETLVADINPNCPGRSVGHTYICVDTSDRYVMLKIARLHGVALVLAEQSDRFVTVAAYVNEKLNLPGPRPPVAERFTNKLAMRQQLLGIVKMPAFQEVDCVEDALAFGEREGYPLILKPKAAQSSIGVYKIDIPQHIRDRFPASLTASRDGQLLVERFIEGPEITVEGVSINGDFHALAISEKTHYAFNPCVAKRLSYPPRYEERLMKRIRKVGKTVVETLGLKDGISHAEYRLREGDPYLIEVAARGGGTRIASRIVPHVCGFDVYSLLVRRLLGEEVVLPMIGNRAAVLNFLDFEGGKVKAIYGVEQAQREGLAEEIVLAFNIGDFIHRPEDDRQRLGYSIVFGENRDDVDARCQRIEELIQVEYE